MTNLAVRGVLTSLPAHNRKGNNSRLGFPAVMLLAFLFCAVAMTNSPAQSTFFTTLTSLGPIDASPNLPFVQATDGNFYDTGYDGGTGDYCSNNGCGTVFKMTPAGTATLLYSFCASGLPCTDGRFPTAGLVHARDGNFYGTTSFGGANSNNDYCWDGEDNGCGTVFKITPSGTLTTLYSFCAQPECTDGSRPSAALVQGADGNLYGTASQGGGSVNCPRGCGTVFEITPSGTLTTLHHFAASTDGADPGGMVLATDGSFYGTTIGTAFKMTPSGLLTTLVQGLPEPDGLVQASDGNFYGTTYVGGMYGNSGTVFKMTPAGNVTTLYDFCSQSGCTDGLNPIGGVIQATDGNFYGTTILGGAYNNEYCGLGCGTIFRVTALGALTTLHNFCASGPPCTDGSNPTGPLFQARDRTFYGTAGNMFFRIGIAHTCSTCRRP
jgi:uncharacterized repeat protein (TIGR03803 family)